MSRWTTRFACAWRPRRARRGRGAGAARRRGGARRSSWSIALAVDVLEDEVGLAAEVDTPASSRRAMFGCVSRARIVPSRRKRSSPRAPDEADVQQLDGDEPLEPAVAAAREPDRSHAALADGLDERVGADHLAGQRRRGGPLRPEIEKPLAIGRAARRAARGARRRAPDRLSRGMPATRRVRRR